MQQLNEQLEAEMREKDRELEDMHGYVKPFALCDCDRHTKACAIHQLVYSVSENSAM